LAFVEDRKAKNQKMRILVALVWVLLTAGVSAAAPPVVPGPPRHSAWRVLAGELNAAAGPRDAVLVASPRGRILARINIDRALVPASLLKLLTTLAALDRLGPSYRFRTDFYLDPENNLKIKGYGDPLLISEEIKIMAGHLATRLPSVHHLILDDSYFEQPIRIPGRGTSTEPYDAPNGALCVNFNTVAFTRRNGHWESDEAQTPLLPSVIPKIAASGLTRGRITLAANSTEALAYTGELFGYFFKQAGLKVSGAARRGRVDPQTDRLVWTHLSPEPLSRVVSELLEYSNNFIANQILLVMGAQQLKAPATVDKGLQVLREYYRRDLGIQSGRIVEASGISRENRITARAMLKILQRYLPFHTLMRQQGRQYFKTGHLKGVRTRAGYLTAADGALYPFVVMCNTPGKSTHAMIQVIEKRFLQATASRP
jgi:serine-type D-Ala-D-Ala carboxypeptidase/endopeptidase (penicillin-binding protein 4)